VNELGGARDLWRFGESLLEPVLDRLDVVVGRALDRLDALGIGRSKLGGRRGKLLAGSRRKRRHFADSGLVRERRQPGKLDPDSIADESVFAEVLGESGHLLAVSSVQRT
jgi:hypothetical protein